MPAALFLAASTASAWGRLLLPLLGDLAAEMGLVGLDGALPLGDGLVLADPNLLGHLVDEPEVVGH